MQQPQKNKWDLCDDHSETFALLYDDPEGGEAGLRKLLPKVALPREELEDAALSLTDAGMRRAAKIIMDFAKDQFSECDRDVCPWPEGSSNARNWHQSLPMRQQTRRDWRAEQRRRKREGSW
jgi:hypothetical protein